MRFFQLFGRSAQPVTIHQLIDAAKNAGCGYVHNLPALIERNGGHLSRGDARRVIAHMLDSELNTSFGVTAPRNKDLLEKLLTFAPRLNFMQVDPTRDWGSHPTMTHASWSEPAVLAVFHANAGRPQYLQLMLARKAISPRMAQTLMRKTRMADVTAKVLRDYTEQNTTRHRILAA